MDKMIAEYKSISGIYIVKVSENKYYYGNGETTNAFGISANQFLRFNPYMEKAERQNVPKHIEKKISEMLKEIEK
jgi:hypothetical protein